MKQQSGFTLIEMAVVLVIIGLLVGGVFKGQQLIETANIKSTLRDIDNFSTAIHAYTDRFRQLPGDDGPIATLQARGGNWSAAISPNLVAGDVDGVLDVSAAQTFTGAGENGALFQQLRAAGFLTGNANDTGVGALPKHALGGLMGVSATAVSGMPVNGRYLCLGSVTGRAARAIDLAKDDGVANTGSMRATEGAGNVAPSAPATIYDDGLIYTLCYAF